MAKEEGVVQRSAAGGAVAEDSGLASAELDDEDGKRDETSACRDKVTVFERRLRDDEGYAPAPEEHRSSRQTYVKNETRVISGDSGTTMLMERPQG